MQANDGCQQLEAYQVGNNGGRRVLLVSTCLDRDFMG